jgi:hypothetical protein
MQAIAMNTYREFSGIGFLLQLQEACVEVGQSDFFVPVDICFALDCITL